MIYEPGIQWPQIRDDFLLHLMGDNLPPVDNRKQLTAYLTILEGRAREWLEQEGFDYSDGHAQHSHWGFDDWWLGKHLLGGFGEVFTNAFEVQRGK